MPYFPLPPYYQIFEDTEGRFPMKELAKELAESDDAGSFYWYARVLPEDGNPAQAAYLSLIRDPVDGKLKLRRPFPTDKMRFIATLRAGPAVQG